MSNLKLSVDRHSQILCQKKRFFGATMGEKGDYDVYTDNMGYSLFQALPDELVYEINLMARDVYSDERKADAFSAEQGH